MDNECTELLRIVRKAKIASLKKADETPIPEVNPILDEYLLRAQLEKKLLNVIPIGLH
jgi:hypothetical protein